MHGLRALLVILTTLAGLAGAVAWQGSRPAADSPPRLSVLQERGPRWYRGNLP
jgi:hypothetical protein